MPRLCRGWNIARETLVATMLSRTVLPRQTAPRGRKGAAKGNAWEKPSSREIAKSQRSATEPPSGVPPPQGYVQCVLSDPKALPVAFAIRPCRGEAGPLERGECIPMYKLTAARKSSDCRRTTAAVKRLVEGLVNVTRHHQLFFPLPCPLTSCQICLFSLLAIEQLPPPSDKPEPRKQKPT